MAFQRIVTKIKRKTRVKKKDVYKKCPTCKGEGKVKK